MSKVLDRIMKYSGKKRNQVSNPCITANEAIELANSIDFIKRISEAKSRDIAAVTEENVKLRQKVINLQAVIDEANAQQSPAVADVVKSVADFVKKQEGGPYTPQIISAAILCQLMYGDIFK